MIRRRLSEDLLRSSDHYYHHKSPQVTSSKTALGQPECIQRHKTSIWQRCRECLTSRKSCRECNFKCNVYYGESECQSLGYSAPVQDCMMFYILTVKCEKSVKRLV